MAEENKTYYTRKNNFWQCGIMLDGGKEKDQKKCADYKKWDSKCYWYRTYMADKCDFPEWKNRDEF